MVWHGCRYNLQNIKQKLKGLEMLKRYMVSLELSSEVVSLKILQRIVGKTNSLLVDTHKKGSAIAPWRRNGKKWKVSLISISPKIRDDAEIIDHFMFISDRLDLKRMFESIIELNRPVRLLLRIGVLYYDTINCTINIPPDMMRKLGECGASLAVTTYPCQDESPDENG